MSDKTSKIMFALLSSNICGTLLSDEEKSLYDTEMLPQLTKIAKQHDVLHLLALGLKNNDLLDENAGQLETEIFKAVYRYEMLQYEYENLCAALEKAQIRFLPLKGSVIRKLYPEPWMRTSCDIDILVREEDLDRAKSILIEEYGYTFEGKGSHDVSLFAPTKIHVELHYDLVEEGLAKESSEVLKAVWESARAREGFEYWFEMPDEMFYFYHIAHMAKHFENGGCGVRTFLDLWILDHKVSFDKDKRNSLLAKGKLLTFAQRSELLSEIWFGNAEHTDITQQMQNYILRGGVYGTNENRIAVQQQKQGGRLGYVLSKIFLPYDVIKFHYPILQKHRWLTPFMQVRRWCKLIFCGHLRRTTRELQYNNDISKEEAANTRAFLENIGL